MTQQRPSRKPNGHPGPNGRPNSHGPAYAPARPCLSGRQAAGGERGGASAPACTDRLRGHAASDDASRDPVALATACAATNLQTQADTDCEAYAAAAPPPPNEAANRRSTRGNPAGSAKDDHEVELPTGKYPLPDNPAEFVEEIHRKVDLTEVWHRLLRSKDEKVRQRAIEKLTGMLYDGGAISDEEPQQFVMDIDSAAARRAAEGAKK